MLSEQISQFELLADKLNGLHGQLGSAPDGQHPALEQSYMRLQSALREVQSQPDNAAKMKLLRHAVDSYQMAGEMVLIKAMDLMEKAQDAGMTHVPIAPHYQTILSDVFQSNHLSLNGARY